MRIFLKLMACWALFAPLKAQTPVLGTPQQAGEKPEHLVLAYPPLREADVFWEKRIWRDIDLTVVENRHFAQWESPFFQLVLDGLANGQLVGYRADDFAEPVPTEEMRGKIRRLDTLLLADENAPGGVCTDIVDRSVTARDVMRFRVQEIWFFDKQRSRYQVRVIGIAPLALKRDNLGEPYWEYPLCWIHYPDSRLFFAQHAAPLDPRSRVRVSWEALFEAHYFFGPITKLSNVWDASLEQLFEEEDARMMSERIQENLFNFEHDLWIYQK